MTTEQQLDEISSFVETLTDGVVLIISSLELMVFVSFHPSWLRYPTSHGMTVEEYRQVKKEKHRRIVEDLTLFNKRYIYEIPSLNWKLQSDCPIILRRGPAVEEDQLDSIVEKLMSEYDRVIHSIRGQIIADNDERLTIELDF